MTMNIYLVGGAVRDSLLGREPNDFDFVVVGSTPEEMTQLGFSQVGADFPVFLNRSGEEFALARTEKKVAAGYNGFETTFDPSVTLKDDLFRRDLTINAMARHNDTEELIDPFNGQQDLRDGIIRHVSEAFAEDPVRILRAARFRARYGFTIAPETMDLMKKLVEDGEVDHLVPERVWAEMEKAFMEDYPSLFFRTLFECGAMERILPELKRSLFFTGNALKRLAQWDVGLNQRVMVLCSETSPSEVETMLNRLQAPTVVIQSAVKYTTILEAVQNNETETAEQMVALLKKIGAWRNVDMIRKMSIAFASMLRLETINKFDKVLDSLFNTKDILFASLTAEQRENLQGKEIGEAIDNLRLEKIRTIVRS